jgi:hypothetical protein
VDELPPIYEIVEASGLNSGEVLATLFALEIKGLVRATRRKTVQQGVVVSAGVSDPRATKCTLRMV